MANCSASHSFHIWRDAFHNPTNVYLPSCCSNQHFLASLIAINAQLQHIATLFEGHLQPTQDDIFVVAEKESPSASGASALLSCVVSGQSCLEISG